jgi:hypothetical protein
VASTGIQAQNFLAIVPSLGNLTGAGTIDAKNNLDFKMVATLAKEKAAEAASGSSSSGAGGSGNPAALLGGLLGKAGGSGCKSGLSVPFQIQGTTADPKFIPDVGGLAAGMFKSQLGCLGGLGGSSAGSQPGQAQNPVDAITGLFGKKKKPQ